jgi:hypothetical protein
MTPVLESLSQSTSLQPRVRCCLAGICFQLATFKNHKEQSGDGWEALVIVAMLVRCVTNTFCNLDPLHGSYYEVSWNEPFMDTVNFGCKTVDEFISGIPFRKSERSLTVYYPTNSKFEAYDIILAYWDDDGARHLLGYQLKEGKAIPKREAMENVFCKS